MIKNIIQSVDALERAVVISLFTWRRAEQSDPVDDDERYGYWGDSFPNVAKDKIGSRLWLLRRRKLDAQTIRDAERYAKEALAWITDDDVATAVNVQVIRIGNDRLDLIVTLTIDKQQRQLSFENVLELIDAI